MAVAMVKYNRNLPFMIKINVDQCLRQKNCLKAITGKLTAFWFLTITPLFQEALLIAHLKFLILKRNLDLLERLTIYLQNIEYMWINSKGKYLKAKMVEYTNEQQSHTDLPKV